MEYDIMKHMYKIIKDTINNNKVTVACLNCGKEQEVAYSTYYESNRTKRKCCRFCGRAKSRVVHGESMTRTPEYISWQDMRGRCKDSFNDSYSRYGGRGIKVCDRWNANDGSGFTAFLEDMGRKPGRGYTLDRIDPDGDYSPENCRWASPKEQAMNKKSTIVVEWNGEKDSLTGWAKRLNMVVPAVKYNYEHGLPLGTRRRPLRNKKYNGKSLKEWAVELDVRYEALLRFVRTHDDDIEEAIRYYASGNRRKYPWANRPSEVRAL